MNKTLRVLLSSIPILLSSAVSAQDGADVRYRTMAEFDDTGSFRSDGQGVYVDGLQRVTSLTYNLNVLCTDREGMTCAIPGARELLPGARYHEIDLSAPVLQSGASERGVVRTPALLFLSGGDSAPENWPIHIPIGERRTRDRTELHFYLNGTRHLLQMGPTVAAQAQHHGEGTSRAVVVRKAASEWEVNSGTGGIARLWDLGTPTAPRDLGLYHIAFSVRFREPTLEELLAQVEDPSPQVREESARYLGRLGARAMPAVVPLRQLTADPRAFVREAARGSLDSIFGLAESGTVPSEVFLRESVDTAMVRRIREEATANSKVMEHAWFLTDVFGPRLTGSPLYRAAGEWLMGRLGEMGLNNAHFEFFPWGRSWSLQRQAVEMITPQHAALSAVAVPFSPSTDGEIVGDVVFAFLPGRNAEASEYERFFEQYRGQLRGRIILAAPPADPAPEPRTRRPTDLELGAGLANGELGSWLRQSQPRTAPIVYSDSAFARQNRLNVFLREQGVAAILLQGMGYGGTIMNDSFRSQPAWLRRAGSELPPPTLLLNADQNRRIARLLGASVPVALRVSLQTEFHLDPKSAFNVVAEIPGTDRSEELVLIGAHLDSWTGATGATDNAAGVAVVMEAIRILRTLEVQPRRTIRLVLWGGHEGDGIGSATHLAEHYAAGLVTDWMLEERVGKHFMPTAGHSKVSAYFNLDNGAGKIRGIYDQLNVGVRPIFKAWFAPFENFGTMFVSSFDVGGTDHFGFDAIGIPGFQFVQDLDEHYFAWTHHSDFDSYDSLPEADLQQSAMILASFAYHAAMREELLPRKPMP